MFPGGMEMEHWLEIGWVNTEKFYVWLPNLSLHLPTSGTLFNRITIGCEWDLNPQLRLRVRHANHYTNNTLKFGYLSLDVRVVGSSPIEDVL